MEELLPWLQPVRGARAASASVKERRATRPGASGSRRSDPERVAWTIQAFRGLTAARGDRVPLRPLDRGPTNEAFEILGRWLGVPGLPTRPAGVAAPPAVILTGPLLGINGTKAWYQEDEQGENSESLPVTEDQFEDCARLGAGVIRQFGLGDLLWRHLAGAVEAQVPVTLEDLRTLLRTTENVARVADELRYARDRGLRVVFTVLTIGGGESDFLDHLLDEPVGTDVLSRWVWAWDTIGWCTVPPVGVESVPPLLWSPEHTAIYSSGGYIQDLCSLDPGDGYKVQYLQLIGLVAVEIILLAFNHVAVDSSAPLLLTDLIYGIEVFNEVDAAVRVLDGDTPDPAASAAPWADAYCRLASAMYEAFLYYKYEPPPFHMPGISSPDAAEAPHNWPYRMAFLDRFLSDVANFMRVEGYTESELASRIDLHHYHFLAADDRHQGPLHIGELHCQAYQLMHLLNEYGMSRTLITVFENGMPTGNPDTTGASVPPGVSADVFQAREVWRRLLGAMSSPWVSLSGWHSWFGVGSYQGFGLRDDRELQDAENKPINRTQRRAWYSYQRLAEIIAEAAEVRLLYPTGIQTVPYDVGSPIALPEGVLTSPVEDLLIFEIERPGDWVYVALIDPWQSTAEVCVSIAAVDGSSGPPDVIASIAPDEGDPTPDAPASGGYRSSLPYDDQAAASSPFVALPQSDVRIRLADDPLILRSDVQLLWTPAVCPARLTSPRFSGLPLSINGEGSVSRGFILATQA